VRLVEHMGSDLSIVRNARVSYDADWRSGDGLPEGVSTDPGKDAKLIEYLLKNKHTSPFEAVVFTFEVKAPIFVFRQWHRHRTWSYNEVSARYTELDEGFYVPSVEHITTQSTSNKQMRTTDQHPFAEHIQQVIESECQTAHGVYQNLILKGCPRELARAVLPGAAYSRMMATCNLHNLLHNFIPLRMHSHAQYEIRVYAQAIYALLHTIVPVTVEAYSRLNDDYKRS